MEDKQPKLPSFVAYQNQDASLEQLENLHRLFIQNVSHELRTPLSIVLGYAQLLHAGTLGSLTEEQNQAIFIIARKAQRLTEMVEQLGILMEIESGESNTGSPATVEEIIRPVMEKRQPAAKKAGLNLIVDIEAPLPSFTGNVYHLTQALDSLVENATKFTPEGGRVVVHAYGEEDHVVLCVQDTGIGIPEKKLDRLLSGFYQVDGSSTRHYGGLGLGLTLVNKVADEHEAQVHIRSQEGAGTTCTLRLPVRSSQDERAEPTPQTRREHRILVVDDEEVVGITMQAGLEKIPHFKVTVATDGEMALQLCEQQHFDLVITDYRMPDMDGLELSRRLRQVTPKTVIMFITAYDSEDLHRQAELLDVQQIIKKPVKIREVREVTSRLLGSS